MIVFMCEQYNTLLSFIISSSLSFYWLNREGEEILEECVFELDNTIISLFFEIFDECITQIFALQNRVMDLSHTVMVWFWETNWWKKKEKD